MTELRTHHAEGSSFHLPMRFLPSAKRDAMHTLYGFCRQADDAVDETSSAPLAKQQLLALRAGIFNLYGNPKATAREPLQAVIAQYGLKRDYFDAILDGMEMDIGTAMLRPSLETLSLYCYRVASCVGLLSVAILGAKGKAAEQFSIALGHALQLTNILRDIEEDAARGRLYLPREWLAEEGIADIAPDALHQHADAVGRVCGKLADLATRYFLEADALSFLCSRRTLASALLMRDIYRHYLAQLYVQDDFLAAAKIRIGFFTKLKVAAGGLRYLFSS